MNTAVPPVTPLSPELERQARRNVALRHGWLVHACAFLLVNAGLWLAGHRNGWLGLPTGGWFIGLLIHSAVVWLRPGSDNLRQRMLDAERRRLQGR
jgi:hypothetical protein